MAEVGGYIILRGTLCHLQLTVTGIYLPNSNQSTFGDKIAPIVFLMILSY